jgi:hypothetical protein
MAGGRRARDEDGAEDARCGVAALGDDGPLPIGSPLAPTADPARFPDSGQVALTFGSSDE